MPFDDRTAAIQLDLVNAFETGRTPDIETLVRAYYPDVLRLAMSLLDDASDAEDAAQETFIAAAAGLDGFRGDSKIKTWLFGIAINVCRAQRRKLARRNRLQGALQVIARLASRSQSPEQAAVRNETGERLRAAVAALDEKHRVPIVLFYLHDLPVPEIARILGTRTGTVYSRLHYARKHLQGLIRDG
ncbi:MAG TPA: RNA polymerase sigma factor [Anaerolineales bacterium]|nr:RNA polymerase sigma factor [Anaerolineales bacterium]